MKTRRHKEVPTIIEIDFEDEEDMRDNVYHLIESDRAQTVEEIAARLDTSTKFGLDNDEVAAKLETDGLNIQGEPPMPSELYKLMINLVGLHNLPLWFGMSLYFLAFVHENMFPHQTDNDRWYMENLYIGLVLTFFVIGFSVFSYYMDAKCEYYLLTCRDFARSWVVVVREGVPARILKEELVVGDLILLSSGDQLRADVKLVEATGLKINIPLLSARSKFYYNLVYDQLDGYFHRGDVLLYNTYIETGHGVAIVLRAVDHFVSRSTHTKLDDQPKSRLDRNRPLTVEVNAILHNLSFVAIGIGFVYATSSVFNGYSWLDSIILAISLYVGIITEALQPTLNVCKSQISKDLANKNCYIQNVNVLELLGRTTTVLTNKTGILTRNKMIVNRLWFDRRQWPAYDFMRSFRGAGRQLDEPLRSLVRCGTLCNFALFTNKNKTIASFVRDALGKPTEVALLRFWEAFWMGQREEYRKQFKRSFEFPYSPRRDCSLGVYHCADKVGEVIVCLKGSPELLIEHSRYLVTSQGVIEFGVAEKLSLLELCSQWSNEKEKLLAFAQFSMKLDAKRPLKVEDFDDNFLAKNAAPCMQLIGLVSMLNPVHMSVLEAVGQCRRAGIQVIITTGDHPQLAHAVANLIGSVDNRNRKERRRGSLIHGDQRDLLHKSVTVIDGKSLKSMAEEKLASTIKDCDNLVFARVKQDSKLRILQSYQANKATVAVTGVGTKCMPIFDLSDIRIALGIYGTDISKNNADIILLDDNFSSIVQGIEHGRVLMENLGKSLVYTLSSKTAEVVLYPMYYFFQIPKIGSSFTIIILDLFTDNLPPISLAYEPIESHVMQHHHSNLNQSMVFLVMLALLYYGLIQFLCGYLAFLIVMAENGFWWSRLVGLRRKWYSPAINDLVDSYGQEWTYVRRRELEYTCHTAYFDTIVIVRMVVLLCCRSKRDSYLRHLFDNKMANFAMIFVVFFTLLMTYYPPFQYGLRMYPLKLEWWLVGFPFGVIMLVFDEIRKWIIRRYPHSDVARVITY